jgi:hypothetical protein
MKVSFEKIYVIYRYKLHILGFLSLLVCATWLGISPSALAGPSGQQPTVAIPTVTGSPSGPLAVVNPDQDQINVRSGPSVDYPIVGVVVAGQRLPALGRSPGGDWVLIAYPGTPEGVAWVYSFLITLQGSLPIVEPPPTPTPLVTPTIDPTLAAQFIIEIKPTRLPTFTPPPPVVIPTYTAPAVSQSTVGVPVGFVIIGTAALGLLGLFISLLRGR